MVDPTLAEALLAKELDATERIEGLLAEVSISNGANEEDVEVEDMSQSLAAKGWKEIRPGVFVPNGRVDLG